MATAFAIDARRAIRKALVRDSYNRDHVRLVDTDIRGYDWLVTTHNGLYAVNLKGAKLVAHGWFFGICLYGPDIYLFENCAQRDRTLKLGRIVKMTMAKGQLSAPDVLVKGLDASCHQIGIVNELLCVIDTANQVILRYALDGKPIDVKTPFPLVPATGKTGAYLHMNSVAQIGDRIAIMLHNGKVSPEKCSELAWLDSEWQLLERVTLDGRCCHDIVADDSGTIWCSASMTGELLTSDGRRVKIDFDRMTRGLACSGNAMIVGISSFGPRQNRDALPGAVVVLDGALNRLAKIELGGPPADIVAI